MSDIKAAIAKARALIFDCDGTLVDTPRVYAKAWAAGLRLSGIEMPPQWYLQRAGMSEGVLMDAFEKEHSLTLPREDVVQTMRAAFRDGLVDLQEIRLITAIVRENFSRIPMAVASGGSREIVNATLEATRLVSYFQAIVTIDDVDHAKPSPDLFIEAAHRLGVIPAECLVFEDSIEGLEAAHRAAMPAVDVVAFLNSRPNRMSAE